MKYLKLSLLAICTLLAAVILDSCQKEPAPLVNNQNDNGENKAEIEYAEKILTTIDLGENGKIQFSEFAPGEILISALVKNTVKLPTERLDFKSYYEYVKNEPAPASLIVAF